MATATFRRDGDALAFAGALVHDAVPALWQEALRALEGARGFDLSAVTAVDSAGLALLAELADRAGGDVTIAGDPPGLSELRRAYRLSPALSFARPQP